DEKGMDILEQDDRPVQAYQSLVRYSTNNHIAARILRARNHKRTQRLLELYETAAQRYCHAMHSRNLPERLLARSAAALLRAAHVGFTAAPAAADPVSADTAAALVDAIEDANDTPGADVITITAPITLTSGLPAIETDLEIIGGGHAISAAGFGG